MKAAGIFRRVLPFFVIVMLAKGPLAGRQRGQACL